MANIMSITITVYIQNILQRWFPLYETQPKQEQFNLQERDLNANCTSWWPAFCLVQHRHLNCYQANTKRPAYGLLRW